MSTHQSELHERILYFNASSSAECIAGKPTAFAPAQDRLFHCSTIASFSIPVNPSIESILLEEGSREAAFIIAAVESTTEKFAHVRIWA